jgi:hypothetical protein
MRIRVKIKFISCILALLASGCIENNKRAYSELEQENSQLLIQLDSLALRLDSIMNEQNSAQSYNNRADLLSESDVEYFAIRGLGNPVEVIKTDLIKNNKLIPVEGSLGGTMQFYKERIHVLNRQWVMAYFEDGHHAGEMLLEYKVGNNGNISWKVLTTRMM